MTVEPGGIAIDPRTGLAIPQSRVPLGGHARLGRPRPHAIGHITYRCHTCGESIVKPWEVLFVDDTPGKEYASNLAPGKVTRGTTTHHDWHMASEQYPED
jgi:hypothetical protein